MPQLDASSQRSSSSAVPLDVIVTLIIGSHVHVRRLFIWPEASCHVQTDVSRDTIGSEGWDVRINRTVFRCTHVYDCMQRQLTLSSTVTLARARRRDCRPTPSKQMP